MNARARALMHAIDEMTGRYGDAVQQYAHLAPSGDQEALAVADRACDRRFRAVQRLTTALANLTDESRIPRVRQLCDSYKDVPPPIYRDPTSEHGKGYNAGTRYLARAVLSVLDGDGA